MGLVGAMMFTGQTVLDRLRTVFSSRTSVELSDVHPRLGRFVFASSSVFPAMTLSSGGGPSALPVIPRSELGPREAISDVASAEYCRALINSFELCGRGLA